MTQNIPDGYELVAGRGREVALQALALAEERGLDPQTVLTSSHLNGFLVPTGDEPATADVVEIEAPAKNASKGDLEAFAEKWNITLPEGGTKAEYAEAIDTEIERRTAEAEAAGVLTDGTENEGE